MTPYLKLNLTFVFIIKLDLTTNLFFLFFLQKSQLIKSSTNDGRWACFAFGNFFNLLYKHFERLDSLDSPNYLRKIKLFKIELLFFTKNVLNILELPKSILNFDIPGVNCLVQPFRPVKMRFGGNRFSYDDFTNTI